MEPKHDPAIQPTISIQYGGVKLVRDKVLQFLWNPNIILKAKELRCNLLRESLQLLPNIEHYTQVYQAQIQVGVGGGGVSGGLGEGIRGGE